MNITGRLNKKQENSYVSAVHESIMYSIYMQSMCSNYRLTILLN